MDELPSFSQQDIDQVMPKKRSETLGSVASPEAVHQPPSRMPARQITEIDTVVGRRIRFRRTMLDLSSEEVAEKIGVAHQQLLKYENAQNRVSAGRLYKLASVLDVPVHWFFSELRTDPASPDVVPANGQGGESQAIGDELAELVRLFTGITDADIRKHYLQSLRLLHRASGTR
ncbi:MAG: helix-turn-helix domain-containing protein [Hyphomicrobiaceae bacterium]